MSHSLYFSFISPASAHLMQPFGALRVVLGRHLYSEKWGGSKNRSTIEISKGGKIGVGGFRVNIDKWAFRISWSFEKRKQLCQSNHMGKIKLVFLPTEALEKERGGERERMMYAYTSIRVLFLAQET